MVSKCSGCREGASLPFAITTAYQPIIDVGAGQAYAYEALVRGSNGESAASVLAQVTDENRYAFDQACRVSAIEGAVAAGLLDTDARLSINFLPNAVYSPMACIQLTLKTAARTGLPADRLIFEFTENERIEADHLRAIVTTYQRLGFATALDDFGAGHSGLALLANLQTDVIKLDMDLIRGVDGSLPRRLIVEGVVRMCAGLGIRLIAEGVETIEEMRALEALGVRYMQGYFFARPAIGVLPKPMLPLEILARAA